jgi:hypothetical protein
MKIVKQCSFLLVAFALFACNRNRPIVDTMYVDSLIKNYTPSTAAKTNRDDLAFWKGRMDSMPGNFVNAQKYAAALSSRFHMYADIHDLITADSLIGEISKKYKEPGYLLTLAGYDMMQHRFNEAKEYIDTVVQMKAERYATQMMLFDVNFELANEHEAIMILENNYAPSDYAYNFRLSKMDHYKGNLDSSIAHMLKAASLAVANPYLKQAALSNAADLYIHDGNLSEAYKLYKQCIQFNSSDVHSIIGIGWIALVHDKNNFLAKKLFEFAHSQIKSPDPLLKLSQATEEGDSTASKKYALEFVEEAADPVYGNMYNKYLVQLYTGTLNEPAHALAIAQKEISNRATPQTYAWLAWSLFRNGQTKEAYNVYEKQVSGKALEGLELYWMGKMMKGSGKGYNARQFFKAAEKNKYDLSPAMGKDLENLSD